MQGLPRLQQAALELLQAAFAEGERGRFFRGVKQNRLTKTDREHARAFLADDAKVTPKIRPHPG
jgi:hypothetical protein